MSTENNNITIPSNTNNTPVIHELSENNNITIPSNTNNTPVIPELPDLTEDPETLKFMQSYLNKLTELNNKEFVLSPNLKEVVRNLENSLKVFENLSMDEMYEISGHVTKHSPNNFILLHIIGVITGQQFQKSKQS
jgi:hypothetical protein